MRPGPRVRRKRCARRAIGATSLLSWVVIPQPIKLSAASEAAGPPDERCDVMDVSEGSGARTAAAKSGRAGHDSGRAKRLRSVEDLGRKCHHPIHVQNVKCKSTR